MAREVSDADITEATTRLLLGADFSTITIGEVRRKLEGEFGVDLAHARAHIKTVVTAIVTGAAGGAAVEPAGAGAGKGTVPPNETVKVEKGKKRQASGVDCGGPAEVVAGSAKSAAAASAATASSSSSSSSSSPSSSSGGEDSDGGSHASGSDDGGKVRALGACAGAAAGTLLAEVGPRRPAGMFGKECQLSTSLAAFLGAVIMTRAEVWRSKHAAQSLCVMLWWLGHQQAVSFAWAPVPWCASNAGNTPDMGVHQGAQSAPSISQGQVRG